MRHYVRASFQYLKTKNWDRGILEEWKDVMEGKEGEEREEGSSGDGLGPLSPGNMKVSDGVRYHVLDVWVDELMGVAGDDERLGKEIEELLMQPVARLEREGRGKIGRQRAKEVLEDERIKGWMERGKDEAVENGDDDDEWGGFDD